MKSFKRLNSSYRIRTALMVVYTLILIFNVISMLVYYHWSLWIYLALSVSCYVQLLIEYVIDRNDGKFY